MSLFSLEKQPTKSTIRIFDHQLPNETHNLYDVTLDDDVIRTLVTHTPSMVDDWISEIEYDHRFELPSLVVGLDIEWRPNNLIEKNNPAATLQLCVGHQCLIFQLLDAAIPDSLINFLGNGRYTFVGVKIGEDVCKLLKDYGLKVSKSADLRTLAAEKLNKKIGQNPGLKTLAREVLGKVVEKPEMIARSDWDNEWLTPDQVQYACIDAFLSIEIWRSLKEGKNCSGYGFRSGSEGGETSNGGSDQPKDGGGATGIGFTAAVVGLIAGGIAAALARKN